MNFHRGQLEALRGFVEKIRVIKLSSTNWRENDGYEKLQEQILNAPPWKKLIGKLEFGQILWRQVFRLVNAIPPEYEGMLSDFDNGSVRDRLLLKIQEEFESLPQRY